MCINLVNIGKVLTYLGDGKQYSLLRHAGVLASYALAWLLTSPRGRRIRLSQLAVEKSLPSSMDEGTDFARFR
jgi:hypothetical protein